MSDKIRKHMDKPLKKQIIEEVKPIDPVIENLLNETVRISTSDKEAIYHYIEHPGNKTYTLKTYKDTHDERDRNITISRKSGNMVLITYNSEFSEVTDFLIDLCDEMGYPFKSADQTDNTVTIFQIFVR